MKHIFDSQDEKITEKAFLQSVIISVIGILICIVALCSATFCWFTGETESGSNTLTSGSFDLEKPVVVLAAQPEGEEVAVDVTPDEGGQGVWVYRLTEVGTYRVTLTLKEGSTVKGHCIVTVCNGAPLHTAAIGEPTEQDADLTISNPLTFTIVVDEADLASGGVRVTFKPRWGVVVDPAIANGGTYEDASNQAQTE